MAVTANHNKIKILANPFAHELLQTSENLSANRLTVLPETLQKVSILFLHLFLKIGNILCLTFVVHAAYNLSNFNCC